MAAVAASYEQFKELNTEVLAISTDSVFSHKVFTETSSLVKNVTYPLLSDRTHKISRAYRVLNEKVGAAYRATIIINPEGIIELRNVYPLEVGRNIFEIIRVLQGIQYERETGEVVPANWVPGQRWISRDSRYIGKI